MIELTPAPPAACKPNAEVQLWTAPVAIPGGSNVFCTFCGNPGGGAWAGAFPPAQHQHLRLSGGGGGGGGGELVARHLLKGGRTTTVVCRLLGHPRALPAKPCGIPPLLSLPGSRGHAYQS